MQSKLLVGQHKRWAVTEGFRFDLKAKRPRLSDGDLLAALQDAATTLGGGYFPYTRYDSLPGTRPHSATIIERFWIMEKGLGPHRHQWREGTTLLARGTR